MFSVDEIILYKICTKFVTLPDTWAEGKGGLDVWAGIGKVKHYFQHERCVNIGHNMSTCFQRAFEKF